MKKVIGVKRIAKERLLLKRTIKVLKDYISHKDVEMHVFAELLKEWEEFE